MGLSDSATSLLVRSLESPEFVPLLLNRGDVTNLSGERFFHHFDERFERMEIKPVTLLCRICSPFGITAGLRNFVRKSLCPFTVTCEACL